MAWKVSSMASESGRKFALYGTIALGFGAFSVKFLPNTFLLDQYQNVVQMYRIGMGVPVPEKVCNRVEQVLEDMKVPLEERKSFKLFTVHGFDIFHAGSTCAKTGCIIGIPKNYTYDSCNDVEKSEIMVNQKLVPWNTPEGKALEEAVILSPDAQKYAIACNVSLCRTPYIFFNAMYSMLSICFSYILASNLNFNLQLHARKMHVRGSMYSIVGLFTFGLWAFATDYTTVAYEKKADLEACAIGPEYARGGLEFYDKILARNVALRKLMGPEGEKAFTSYGNEEILFRLKHLPITARKSLVEMAINSTMARNESEQLTSVPK